MSEDKEIERIKRMFNNNTYGSILGQDIECLLSKISKLEKELESYREIHIGVQQLIVDEGIPFVPAYKALKESEEKS